MNVRAIVQRYNREIYRAPSLTAAIDLLSATVTEFGFAGASSVFWPHCKDTARELTPPVIRLSGSNLGTRAKSWNAAYLERDLFKADFVYRACICTALPVVWSYDCRPQIIVGREELATVRELMGIEEMVRITGLRGGVSVPVRGPSGFFGYVAFSSTAHAGDMCARYEDLGDHLLGMAYRFYDATGEKLLAHERTAHRLTPREIECLSLLAVGKTLEEAAEIVGLSSSTIRFHLYNAERKLGTHHRAHAIAKAASLGLLGPL